MIVLMSTEGAVTCELKRAPIIAYMHCSFYANAVHLKWTTIQLGIQGIANFWRQHALMQILSMEILIFSALKQIEIFFV